MTRLTQRRKLVTRVVKVTPVAASIAALFLLRQALLCMLKFQLTAQHFRLT